MKQSVTKTCAECGSQDLYVSTRPLGLGILARLQGWFRLRSGNVELVICADCGFTRIFATEWARSNLPTAEGWRHLRG